MKISAAIAVWMCAIFALVCLGFALTGFTALPDLVDEAERESSWGYVGFWTFLAVVAMVFGVLSWMISKGKFGDVE
jgi:sensor domain CHASE-containing protein